MAGLVNSKLIPGQSKANSLRKAYRLRRRAAGIEPPWKIRQAYEQLLSILYLRVQR